MSNKNLAILIVVGIILGATLTSFFSAQKDVERANYFTEDEEDMEIEEQYVESQEDKYLKTDQADTLEELFPPDAEIIKSFDINLHGDDYHMTVYLFSSKIHEDTDELAMYLNVIEHTPVSIVGIHYTRIKEDRISSDFAESGFVQVLPIKTDGKKELLFVHKVLKAKDMYYVFGKNNQDQFEDFPISRAYLNSEKYIKDEYLVEGKDCVLEFKGPIYEERLGVIYENYRIVCYQGHSPQVTGHFSVEQKFVGGRFVVADPIYHQGPEKITEDFEAKLITAHSNWPVQVWYKGKMLVSSDQFAEIGGMGENMDREAVSVFHVNEGDQDIDIYLAFAGGCEGCYALNSKYISIDKETSNFEVVEVEDEGVFYDRCAANAYFSPDQKKFVCHDDDQDLYLYDFDLKKQTKLYSAPKTYSLGRLGCMGICNQTMYWANSDVFAFEIYKTEQNDEFPTYYSDLTHLIRIDTTKSKLFNL